MYPEEKTIDTDIEHLPTLCLPDQSHNFESDSVYFVLPNKEQSEKKIFGKRWKFDDVCNICYQLSL